MTWIDSLKRRFLVSAEKTLKAIPVVNQRIEREYDSMMAEIETSVKPYKGMFPAFTQIPEIGRERGAILQEMEAMRAREESVWKE